MQYILTKANVRAPMFDGRGFLVNIDDDKERRGLMGALAKNTTMYMSRDAIEVVRRWITMCELHVDGNQDFKYLPDVLHFGDIQFVLYDRTDYGYADLKMLKDVEPTKLAEVFAKARENFTIGFDEARWHGQDDQHAQWVMESYNVPGRLIHFNFDNSGAQYNYRVINQPQHIPYVTRDLSMVRIAESLINIANTQTYPYSGYKLDLKLAFGNMELGELDRGQLLEIAQRLIP